MMKIFIKQNVFILLITIMVLSSCEKQGGATSASSSPAGAGGSLARFAIVGNYLYTVDSHSLIAYDITNPAKPVSKGSVFAGFDIETIFPYKDKLFLGASNGLYIFSIADPLNPVKEGSITHFRACDPVVSNDSISYVTLRNNNSTCGSTKNVLNIYNVKDTKNPVLVKEVEMSTPYGLGTNKNALYICQGDSGLAVLDLKDPYNPQKVNTIKGNAYYDVIPYGDILIAFIDKGVSFFDIKDPLNVIKAGTIKD